MSDLRIGQRCRLVGLSSSPNKSFHPCEGDEVTILALPGRDIVFPDHYEISCPQHMSAGLRWKRQLVPRENLRPLTDPGADAFIERIKKLGREPIIETEKVTR